MSASMVRLSTFEDADSPYGGMFPLTNSRRARWYLSVSLLFVALTGGFSWGQKIRPGVAGKSYLSDPNPASADTASGARPESLFDSAVRATRSVTTTIQVPGTVHQIETGSPLPYSVGAEQVLTTAGTYGDISRYLQMFPGVVASSDLSNQMLVRGGHPIENLFLVDDIEVPNINHLPDAISSGGLAPMIDTAVIQGLSLYTGAYDARYPERLSSVTEIRTLDSKGLSSHLEGDLGIQGLGGMASMNVLGGNLLTSAHRGLLNLMTHDIGLNGVPSYTSELTRFRREDGRGDEWSLLSVSGWDGIDIEPCASNTAESSTIDSQYQGMRETTGGEWRQVLSPNSFGVLQVSDSEQIEHIHQQDQVENPLEATNPQSACPLPRDEIQSVPIYQEDSNNAFSTAGFRYVWASPKSELMLGSAYWLDRPHFNVKQPIGAFSSYSVDPSRTDSTSFASNFSTGETGTFAQFSLHPLTSLAVTAGGRLQTFAFGSHSTMTPRLTVQYNPIGRLSLNVAFAKYAQMPPYEYLLAFPQNRLLAPMRAVHEVVGASFAVHRAIQMRVEAYRKLYSAVPAATEYPSVTLHTMVDMLGQQLVWLPMNSTGRGVASGIELSDRSEFWGRIQIQGSVAYSRAKFAGTDGVLRASSYDFPWILNLAGVDRISHNYTVSARFGYSTGRPFTPFDLTASLAQNRPIYDLALVNSERAPAYERLDAQINRHLRFGDQQIELYGGFENLLNHSNFLSYAWMPRWTVNSTHRMPVTTLWQIPIFPNFGVRLLIR